MPAKKKKGAIKVSALTLKTLAKELTLASQQTYCTWLEDRGNYPNEIKKFESEYGNPTAPVPYQMQCFPTREAALRLASTLATYGAKVSVRP